MKDIRFAKFVVALNGIVPVAILGWDAWHHQLGANPVNFAIRTTGLLALIFLLLSLTITPLSRLTGWSWLSHFRRTLGLYAFFHTALHFLIFFGFDRAMSVSSTLTEIIKRPYLWVGTLGLLMMTPLAVTSTDKMIRRLGPKRWKSLHRIAYFAAIAGCLHYYMLVKADVKQPVAFAIVLAALLLYRIIARYTRLRAAYRISKTSPAQGFEIRPTYWKGQLKVARIFQETPDVKTFRLVPITGDRLPFDYLPGQYLNIALSIDGKRVNRSYTIASSPTRSAHCELTVKREQAGTASRHLHDDVHEGDVVNVSAPAGKFTFTGAEARGIVMIAAGVGITPLMSKLRYLTDTGWRGEIYFIFSAKTERDIIFLDELEYLSRRHPNLHLTVTLTRADGAWTGERGRITADLMKRHVADFAMHPVHFCGPMDMTEPMTAVLRELGVVEDRIKFESFTSPKRADGDEMVTADIEPEEGASITFAKSQKSSAEPDGKTVLELAESLGVKIDYDCRSGICGTCKVKLQGGRVSMETQDALDQTDREQGLILACQSRCIDAVTVEA